MSKFQSIQNYDGLSPQTTKGDLAVYGASGSSRLAVGADGTFLAADSTAALGVSYKTPTSGVNVFTLTGATTLTAAGVLIEASGTTFAITMPNAATNSGGLISIVKTDTGFVTPISVIGITTSQVIGLTLSTFNERFDFYSNGSNWKVKQHTYDESWNAWTPTLGTGFGIATNVTFIGRRVGQNWEAIATISTGTVGASAGTITLPAPLVANASFVTIQNTTAAAGTRIGEAWSNGAANSYVPIVTAPGTGLTLVYTGNVIGGTNSHVPGNVSPNFASSSVTSFRFSVPILGWTP